MDVWHVDVDHTVWNGTDEFYILLITDKISWEYFKEIRLVKVKYSKIFSSQVNVLYFIFFQYG